MIREFSHKSFRVVIVRKGIPRNWAIASARNTPSDMLLDNIGF